MALCGSVLFSLSLVPVQKHAGKPSTWLPHGQLGQPVFRLFDYRCFLLLCLQLLFLLKLMIFKDFLNFLKGGTWMCFSLAIMIFFMAMSFRIPSLGFVLLGANNNSEHHSLLLGRYLFRTSMSVDFGHVRLFVISRHVLQKEEDIMKFAYSLCGVTHILRYSKKCTNDWQIRLGFVRPQHLQQDAGHQPWSVATCSRVWVGQSHT